MSCRYVTAAQRRQKRRGGALEYDEYGNPTQRSIARLNDNGQNGIYFQPAERVMQGVLHVHQLLSMPILSCLDQL